MINTNRKTLIKEVYEEMMKTATKEKVELWANVGKHVSVLTTINKKTLSEVVKIFSEQYEAAAVEMGVKVEDVISGKHSNYGNSYVSFREETDEEFSERIRYEAERKVMEEEISTENKRKTEEARVNRIFKLKAELDELTKTELK
jgi:methanogenic corrinoid protein MtbC1